MSDREPADFAAGTAVDLHLAITAGGAELILRPTVAAEFTGGTLPPEWYVEPWKEGGTAELADRQLLLDGASAGHHSLFGSDRSLEFVATFQRRPHQHIGFGHDYRSLHWVTFSTKFGNSLYARTNFFIPEDTRLSASLLGSPHHFRIDWNVLDVDFWVDGQRVAHQLVPMVGYLRPLACNGSMGGPRLALEWLRMTPYCREGTFQSRIQDAGERVAWLGADVDGDLPPGTSVTAELRGGDTPTPDGSWSAWTPPAEGNGAAGAAGAAEGNGAALVSRFVQYRARFSSSKASITPVVRAVTLPYSSSSSSSGPLSVGGTSGS